MEQPLLLAPILVLLSLLLQQPPLLIMVSVAAQTNQLNAGSSMTPTRQDQLIRSSSGVFAFGFCRFDPNLHPDQFILAIWFDFSASDCTNKKVVWFARNSLEDAVTATEQYVLSFQGKRPLSLLNDQRQTVWTPSQKYGSTLVLQESGNLQLFGQSGDGGVSDVLWESFSDLTDTLLPGNNMTNSTAYLLSRNADTDFSSGRFTLIAQNDSNIVTYMRDQESGMGYPYWASGTHYLDGACVPTLFFNESGIYYNLANCTYRSNSNNSRAVVLVQLEQSYTEGYYKYMVLDPDGTIRVHVRPIVGSTKASASWDIAKVFPDDDGCTRRDICGPNSYCTVSTDKYKYLDCSCPEGYEFLDAQHKYKGCRPTFFPYICDGKDLSGKFKSVEMQATSWSTESTYKKHALTPDTSQEEECITSCLRSCLCAAVLIDDNSCMEVWTLTAGRQESGITMRALIKVGPSKLVFPVSLGTKLLYITVGVLAVVSVASIMYNLWQSYVTKKKANKMSIMSGLTSFTYKEMKQATCGFKELLGKGGFGHVFKGELSYLEPPYVAVKRLNRSDEFRFGEMDFDNEVKSIGQIHHKNLARLIGYCKQGTHRMLVFQYMKGGTLADFIFGAERPSWSCIAEAVIGIARGLEYLHEGCKSQIIHCDIKPENILFDDIHTPKITDFGIARLLGDRKTHDTITTGAIAGTAPYAAPEWFDGGGMVDSKVDVYSFGVMLLEMICCRRAAAAAAAAGGGQQQKQRQPNDSQDVMSTMRAWVESLLRRGRADVLVEGESEALADIESVERFARVAIWCLQKEPSARPRMHKVVQMLEGTVDVDPLPDDPPRPLTFVSVILPDDVNREPPSLRGRT